MISTLTKWEYLVVPLDDAGDSRSTRISLRTA